MATNSNQCHALVVIASKGDHDEHADVLTDVINYAQAAKATMYPVLCERERTKFMSGYPGMQRSLDMRSTAKPPPPHWLDAVTSGATFDR